MKIYLGKYGECYVRMFKVKSKHIIEIYDQIYTKMLRSSKYNLLVWDINYKMYRSNIHIYVQYTIDGINRVNHQSKERSFTPKEK